MHIEEGRNVNQFRLLLTALILLGAAAPAPAQMNGYADLGVCNKGTVPVEVVAATKNVDLLRGFGKYYWRIEGTAVAPGKCENVYHDTDAGGAYLAFGFADAKGQWGSGKIAQVPDLGVRLANFREYPVMRSAAKGVCARRDETEKYRIDDDPQTDCAGLRLAGNAREVGHGPLLPLTAALYFEPEGVSCSGGANGIPYTCGGGDYHLNISPTATDRELHAAVGTESGANASEAPDNSAGLRWLLQTLAKAGAEKQQREQQAAASERKEWPVPDVPAATNLWTIGQSQTRAVGLRIVVDPVVCLIPPRANTFRGALQNRILAEERGANAEIGHLGDFA
jgi:hypothetical protein